MSFPAYAEYKDSGIQWLGDVPEEWMILPLHRVIREQRRITYGIVQPGKLDETGRYMVRGQDYSTGWGNPEPQACRSRYRLRSGQDVRLRP